MGRSHVSPIIQHNDVACGPASLKHALAVFGKRKSLTYLNDLCKTSRNGTSTKRMIQAASKLGFSVMSLENATLRHVIGALRYPRNQPRAVLVSYLYSTPEEDEDWKESGHWATVSSYSASNGRIILFDSYSGKKKSYSWKIFKDIWKDYDYKRTHTGKKKRQYKLIRKWQYRPMLVITKSPKNLPAFRQSGAKIYSA
jgi:ABC-type bacteriocin/lantibiotic exporter with double-glycine peptidase domain